MQGSDRRPILPTADTPWLVHRGRTSRGLARLQLLEAYLRALLTAGEHVSRSPVLTGFLAPQAADLEPMLPPGRCLPRGWGRDGGEGPTSGETWRLDGCVADT